jgi:hypothetical protein
MNRREFLKKSLEGIVIGVPLLCNCEKNPVKYSIPIDFETISRGHISTIKEKKSFVINNSIEWNKMYKEAFEGLFSPPENLINVPNTDFLKYTLLAVYMGECPTSGYEIDVSDITESNKAISVKVSEKNPQGSVYHLPTQPYHIVKTTKLKKQVIFESYLDEK